MSYFYSQYLQFYILFFQMDESFGSKLTSPKGGGANNQTHMTLV